MGDPLELSVAPPSEVPSSELPAETPPEDDEESPVSEAPEPESEELSIDEEPVEVSPSPSDEDDIAVPSPDSLAPVLSLAEALAPESSLSPEVPCVPSPVVVLPSPLVLLLDVPPPPVELVSPRGLNVVGSTGPMLSSKSGFSSTHPGTAKHPRTAATQHTCSKRIKTLPELLQSFRPSMVGSKPWPHRGRLCSAIPARAFAHRARWPSSRLLLHWPRQAP